MAPSGCEARHEPVLAAGGATHAKAFEQVALAMFNYMTPLEGIAVDESCTR